MRTFYDNLIITKWADDSVLPDGGVMVKAAGFEAGFLMVSIEFMVDVSTIVV